MNVDGKLNLHKKNVWSSKGIIGTKCTSVESGKGDWVNFKLKKSNATTFKKFA